MVLADDHPKFAASILRGCKFEPLSGDPQVDKELYVWLAVIYRQFISPWYYRINEQGSLPQDIIVTLAKAVRVLLERAADKDLLKNVQDICHILDTHLSDMELAISRSDDNAEQSRIYMALNPHPAVGNEQALREYLTSLGELLIDTLLEDEPLPVKHLLAGLVQQVLTAVVSIVSEPWMVNELVIKSDEAIRNNIAKTAAPGKSSGLLSKLSGFLGLLTHPQATANPYIVELVLHRAAHKSVQMVYEMLGPLQVPINQAANAVAANMLNHINAELIVQTLRNLRRAVFPGGFLGPPRVVPSAIEQLEMANRAQTILCVHGTCILSLGVLGSRAGNQRLYLRLLDYTIRQLSSQPSSQP